MELQNLLYFNLIQSASYKEQIMKDIVKAAQLGRLDTFSYDDSLLTDEDRMEIENFLLTF